MIIQCRPFSPGRKGFLDWQRHIDFFSSIGADRAKNEMRLEDKLTWINRNHFVAFADRIILSHARNLPNTALCTANDGRQRNPTAPPAIAIENEHFNLRSYL